MTRFNLYNISFQYFWNAEEKNSFKNALFSCFTELFPIVYFAIHVSWKLKWLNLINWNGEKLPPTSHYSEIPEWMLLILHHWVIPVVHEAVCLIETPTDWQSWLSPLELTALPRIVHFEHQLHIKTISIVSWLWIRKTNMWLFSIF